jgi:hypothetical protein
MCMLDTRVQDEAVQLLAFPARVVAIKRDPFVTRIFLLPPISSLFSGV